MKTMIRNLVFEIRQKEIELRNLKFEYANQIFDSDLSIVDKLYEIKKLDVYKVKKFSEVRESIFSDWVQELYDIEILQCQLNEINSYKCNYETIIEDWANKQTEKFVYLNELIDDLTSSNAEEEIVVITSNRTYFRIIKSLDEVVDKLYEYCKKTNVIGFYVGN